ncbi:stage III sporulation protein AE [Clostridium sp.]|uniref:stage III sporulation protein AE n=1 Tax=Clostridium sp. TaxID=1506 RepID=UPI00262B2E1D|nr:stage III sporulation protein AE [Clostridium sp.]
MKKIINIILLTVTFLFCFNTNVLANKNLESSKEKINNDSRVEGFYNYINNLETEEEFLENMSAKEYISQYLNSGEDPISIKKIGASIISYMLREVRTVLKFVASILVIALLSALLKNLQDSFNIEDGVTNIAFLACYALIIMLLTKGFFVTLDLGKEVLFSIMDFMNVIVPVLIMLIATSGGITSAVTIDPIVLGAVTITPRIYTYFLFPLILAYFTLQFVNNLSDEFKIDRMCKFIKNMVMLSQGFILTIFVGILTLRGMTADTLDAVAVKTVKFAVDNFVPVVGGAFSDAITTLAGYSLAMKSVISSLGVIVIIVIAVYPMIKMALMALCFKFTAAIIEPVVDSKISSSVETVGESVFMVLSCVISVSLMFFIMTSMLASAGSFIVGG